MKKVFWILLGILFVFAGACGEGEEIMDGNGNNGETEPTDEKLKPELVRIKVGLGSGIEFDTRLVYDDEDSKKIKLLWSENDKIRVYWRDNDNTYHSGVFTLKDGVDTSEGIFEGVAPKTLPENSNYEILYPADKFKETYLGTTDFENQIELSINEQKQIGNGSMEHLSEFNYMRSTEGSLNGFFFKQDVMTLLRLELTFPASYDAVTHGYLSTLSLKADSDIFVPKYGSNRKTSTVNLILDKISLDSERKLVAYVMVYPAALPVNEKILISVQTTRIDMSFNVVYENITNKAEVYEAGKCYTIQGSVTPSYGEQLTVDPISHTINIASAGILFQKSFAISHAVGTENPGYLILDGQVDKKDLSGVRNWLWDYPDRYLAVTLASNVLTEIPAGYFACNNLYTIIAPNITNLEKGALKDCKGLVFVDFPLVTNLKENTFWGCDNLTSVNFPLVTNIGKYAFADCGFKSLSSTNFPCVTNIESYAFASCPDLSSVSLSTVTSIGEAAFVNCHNLSSVDFPAAIYIERAAFPSNVSLVKLTSPNPIYAAVSSFNNTYLPTTDLVLHINNKHMVSGLKWANTTWKSISFVDDNGNSVTE